MDRWMDDDDTPTVQHGAGPGRVARLGMAGFVRAHEAAGPSSTVGVEVVQSRREQRHAAAAAAMPPPRSMGHTQPPSNQPTASDASTSSSSGFPAPPWAVAPPSGLVLQVLKDGVVIQEIPLQQRATVFGRLPANDVVLDHASISRQHAALCFAGPSSKTSAGAAADAGPEGGASCSGAGAVDGSSGSGNSGSYRCLVMDLGSAHGTWVNGERCSKGVPMELPPGGLLHFGASSRRYQLRHAAPPQPPSSWQQPQQPQQATTVSPSRKRRAEGCPLDDHQLQQQQGAVQQALQQQVPQQQQPRVVKRAKRVTFRDEMPPSVAPTAAAAAAAAEAGQALAQVIGYTDGSTFQPQVGPVPATSSSTSQFGSGPTSYLVTPPAAAAGGSEPQQQLPAGTTAAAAAAAGEEGLPVRPTSPLAAAAAAGGGAASPRAQPAKQRPVDLKELERREGQALRAGRQLQQDADEGDEGQGRGTPGSSPGPKTAAAAAAAAGAMPAAAGSAAGAATVPDGVGNGSEEDHHMPDAEEHNHHQQQQVSFRAPAPLQVPASGSGAAATAGGGAAPCSPRSIGPASSKSPRAALGIPGSPRLSPSGTPAGLGMKAVSLAGLPPGRPTPVTTTTVASSSSTAAAAAARASAAGLRAGLQLFQQQVALARAASLEGAGSPRDGAGQQQGGLYAGLVLPEGVQWQQ